MSPFYSLFSLKSENCIPNILLMKRLRLRLRVNSRRNLLSLMGLLGPADLGYIYIAM